jgi:hypothetical protein
VSGDESIILVLLAVLMAKHCVFDFFLQTPYQFLNKGIYGHPGGLLHAGLHVLGTVAAIVILPPTFLVALAILAGEFVIHYHIDWTKEQLERRFKLTPADAGHYFLLGLDQLAHQLTYIGIVAVLISA